VGRLMMAPGAAEVITLAQREVLARLASLVAPDTYLAGGIAVAAHLRHRTSRDLDLFSTSDPTVSLAELERTPGVVITSRAAGTIYLAADGLPVSLIEYRHPVLAPPASIADLAIAVASVPDLMAMKLSAIAGRGAARDFWDLHAMLQAAGLPLAAALDHFARKYPGHDRGHVLRSLAYFGDADAAPLPAGLGPAAWSDLKRAFVAELPALLAGA